MDEVMLDVLVSLACNSIENGFSLSVMVAGVFPDRLSAKAGSLNL